jgi:chaperonin GroES
VPALQGKDYTLIREDDLIGVLPRSGATAADVPELQPLSDRVLLKVRI